ncbi:hypothetical protein FS749_010065 [Ceratobasidium sp. UAMH 11750]|nr:hypothetical protein FS749_010065 [Ceratobasidium sp. UAMH 11750]
MVDAVLNEDIGNLGNLASQFMVHWEESLRWMSKEDFKMYYFRKRDLYERHKLALPPLPAWVEEYAFGNEKLNN